MELIKPQKGTNYNIENDIQNLTSIEQEFEQIDNKITNDITSSIDELKDKVDNDITTAITELDNKVDTEIVTAIDNLETKVNTEISESITALDNKVTTSLQEQAESLKKEISDQIAKVVANSPEDFDTLKEISDWISGHSSNAATMNSAISVYVYKFSIVKFVGELALFFESLLLKNTILFIVNIFSSFFFANDIILSSKFFCFNKFS